VVRVREGRRIGGRSCPRISLERGSRQFALGQPRRRRPELALLDQTDKPEQVTVDLDEHGVGSSDLSPSQDRVAEKQPVDEPPAQLFYRGCGTWRIPRLGKVLQNST
jgi:hypothetical protein